MVQRRCYWILDRDEETKADIVLVHYLGMDSKPASGKGLKSKKRVTLMNGTRCSGELAERANSALSSAAPSVTMPERRLSEPMQGWQVR